MFLFPLITSHFGALLQILRQPDRSGLPVGRSAGAREISPSGLLTLFFGRVGFDGLSDGANAVLLSVDL